MRAVTTGPSTGYEVIGPGRQDWFSGTAILISGAPTSILWHRSFLFAAHPYRSLARGPRRWLIGFVGPNCQWAWITDRTEPYAWPNALPGGRHVVFTDNADGRPEDARVALLSLQTAEVKPLVRGGTNPRYSSTGHILLARTGSLYAVSFDADRAEPTGSEHKLLDGVVAGPNGSAQLAVSANGTLTYIGP